MGEWVIFFLLFQLQLLTSTQKGVEFIYTLPSYQLNPYVFIPNTLPYAEEGKPAIVVKYVNIGVPPGAKVEIEIKEIQKKTKEGIYIPPVKGFTKPKDEKIYSADEFWPKQIVKIDTQLTYRSQEVVRLCIYPLRYNPVQNKVIIYTKLHIKVNFTSYKTLGTYYPEKVFDVVFKHELINYSEAKHWRLPPLKVGKKYYPHNWLKIKIKDEGIYKITKSSLQEFGIKNISPSTYRIFNGGSNMVTPFTDSMIEIPVWVLEDSSIVFYATSLHGWGKNDEIFHNPYYDTNVYWFNWGGQEGKRDSVDGRITEEKEITFFIDTLHIEKDNSCPARGGLLWIWERIERKKEQSTIKRDYKFAVHHLKSGKCKIKFRVYSWYSTYSAERKEAETMPHHIRGYLNGILHFDTSWVGWKPLENNFIFEANNLKEGENVFTLELYKVEDRREIIYFDWFEVWWEHNLIPKDGELKFAGEGVFRIRGGKKGAVIFDITQPLTPKKVYNVKWEDGELKFQGKGNYYLTYNLKEVELEETDPYSIWRRGGYLDFVIITHPDFIEYGKMLKRYREKQGLRVEVFSVEDIYNCFSFGIRHSPYAIRNFLKFAYPNWGVSYCLLLGAGTFAYKDETLGKNRIPPYEKGYKVGHFGYPPSQNHCYDSWFRGGNDLAIGRISAATKEEARDVICEKLMKYEHTPGVWQSRILLIPDDAKSGEDNDGCSFVGYVEGVASQIKEYGEGYDIFRANLFNYKRLPPPLKPGAKEDIIRMWSRGVFFTTFAGHGNIRQLTHEHVIHNPTEIDRLTNKNMTPFSHFASCGVGCFERKSEKSMAGYLQLVKGKGSIATIASTRATSIDMSPAYRIAEYLFEVAKNEEITLGQAVYGKTFTENLPVNCNFFGDPTTRVPKRNIKVEIEETPDTIKGGIPLRVKGKAKGGRYVCITVRSSRYTKTVPFPGGECSFPMRGRIVNERLIEDILFEGLAKVNPTTGEWESTFFIPTNLHEKVCGDSGKISVFAWNDYYECGSEAKRVKVFNDTTIVITDTIGPLIDLYADGTPLKNEQIVPHKFILTGRLEDESGINIVCVEEPKDLVLLLQIGEKESIPLANYFEYEVGSSSRGSFDYPVELDPLQEEEVIWVQASDNVGNRSVVKVTLKISSSEKIKIESVMNTPNPVRGGGTYLTFFLSKDAEVEIKIYTIRGKLIKILNSQNTPEIYTPMRRGMNKVYWDTRDAKGNPVGTGIYLYKIEAKTEEGEITEKTSAIGKIMILR